MSYLSSNWQERMVDINFFNEGTGNPQTFNSNTTYSIGGYTWTKINTANETSNGTKIDSTGLIFAPLGNGSDYGFNTARAGPALTLPLTSILTNFDFRYGIRIWLYVSSSGAAANFDNTGICLENPGTSPGTASQKMCWTAKLGWNGANCFGYQHTINASSALDQNTTTDAGTDNVIMIEVPQLGYPECFWYTGLWSNGWPTQANLHLRYKYEDTSTNNMRTNGALISQWDISLFAIRVSSGTTYTPKLGQFRVDMLKP